MRDFSLTADIAAPPEAIWPILADTAHWPQWTASMRSVERLVDTGPLGVGSRLRVVQPGLLPATYTITEWTPNRNFTWASSNLGLRIVAGHVLEANADGCRVTLSVRFEGLFGAVAGWLFGSRVQQYMAMEGDGLKHRSEAAAQAASPDSQP